MKKTKKHPDLSDCDSSVTSRFMILLTPEYHKTDIQDLKEIALNILNDPGTSVSDQKRIEYETNINKLKSTVQLQFYLTNLTMKGCNLSLHS